MKPEDRLPLLIPGVFCVPVGLFIYGWTAKYHIFWFVPIFGTKFCWNWPDSNICKRFPNTGQYALIANPPSIDANPKLSGGRILRYRSMHHPQINPWRNSAPCWTFDVRCARLRLGKQSAWLHSASNGPVPFLLIKHG
jgi:hypothetical protein